MNRWRSGDNRLHVRLVLLEQGPGVVWRLTKRRKEREGRKARKAKLKLRQGLGLASRRVLETAFLKMGLSATASVNFCNLPEEFGKCDV